MKVRVWEKGGSGSGEEAAGDGGLTVTPGPRWGPLRHDGTH